MLRRFNREAFGMKEPSKSALENLVGMGYRKDKETGKTEPVSSFHANHYEHVVKCFEIFPIHKLFGITVEQAMAMPLDRWYRLRNIVKTMPQNKNTDMELELLKLVRQIIAVRGAE